MESLNFTKSSRYDVRNLRNFLGVWLRPRKGR